MAITSIKDLLDRAGRFEERLADFYAAVRDGSADNGVRLLTYYLARHRRHLQDALSAFDSAQIARIKGTKLKYDVDFEPEKPLTVMSRPPAEIRADELLQAAVDYDLELIRLYRAIHDQPLSSEATALVDSLIKVEERDVVMLKKTMATHYF